MRKHYFICGSGIYVASILCNGDIYSCMDIERRPELLQSSIRTDDFVDVWEIVFKLFVRTDWKPTQSAEHVPIENITVEIPHTHGTSRKASATLCITAL